MCIRDRRSRALSDPKDIDDALQRLLLRNKHPQALAEDCASLCPETPSASLPDNISEQLRLQLSRARRVWYARVEDLRFTTEGNVQEFFNTIVHPIGCVLASDLDVHFTVGERRGPGDDMDVQCLINALKVRCRSQ